MNAGARGYIWAIVYEKPARYDVTDRGPCRKVAPPFVFVSVCLFTVAEAHDRTPERASREARRRSYLFAPRGGLGLGYGLPDSLP
jgi:hypothetical protein